MSLSRALPSFATRFTGLLLVSLLGLSLSVGLTGCQMPESGVGGTLKGGPKVLTVNGQAITKNEYDDMFSFYTKLMKVNGSPEADKNPVVQEVLKQMTLNQLILTALVEQAAKEQKITIQPNELDEQLKKQTKLAGGAEALRKLLEEQNLSEEDFRKSIQKQLLINKVIEAEAGAEVKISQDEAKAYYDSHASEFAIPYSIRASHILVKAMPAEIRNEIQENNENISQEALQEKVNAEMEQRKAEAEKLFNQIKAEPKRFEELAQKKSDDKLASMNKGDLGWLTENFTDAAFWNAANTTETGKLHEGIVKSPFGYHIIWVHEKREPHKQSFNEAQEAIVHLLGQEKRSRFMQQWLMDQQKTVPIAIEPDYQPKNMNDVNGAPSAEKGEKAAVPQETAKKAG